MSSFQVLALLALVCGSAALDCTQIANNQIVPGKHVTIPAGADDTVEVPPNFQCTYKVTVPPMVYAHVRLENRLKGSNDLITVLDEQETKTLVSSRSSFVSDFYVFPNTTTQFVVSSKSVIMHSAFRLVVSYKNIIPASIIHLGADDLKYVTLNNMQVNSNYAPQTVIANEKISLSVAYSDWENELLDNFFVIDGDFKDAKSVYRMNRFAHQSFVSSGNMITVVGLDDHISKSSVVFSLLSQAQKFDSLTAFGTYHQANVLDINAEIGDKQKVAVTVIGMNDYTRILSVAKSSNPHCSLKVVEAPPTESSEVLFDFMESGQFCRNITSKSFSIVAEKCAASFKMVSLNY